jgi:hypothetical protein
MSYIVFTWGWPTLAETCSECNYTQRIFGCYRGKVFVFYFWHIATGCTHQLLILNSVWLKIWSEISFSNRTVNYCLCTWPWSWSLIYSLPRNTPLDNPLIPRTLETLFATKYGSQEPALSDDEFPQKIWYRGPGGSLWQSFTLISFRSRLPRTHMLKCEKCCLIIEHRTVIGAGFHLASFQNKFK